MSPEEANGSSVAFLTVTDVAKYLRISKMTVYRLMKDGAIPGAIRIGRSFRIPVTSLEAYLAGLSAPSA